MTNTPPAKTIFSDEPQIIVNNQGKSLPPFTLSRDYHALGRDPNQVDLVLPPDWAVSSRFQACFRRVGQDYYIFDGDGEHPSANKLFIDNKVITPKQGYKLRSGDEIKIGQNPTTWLIITYYNASQQSVGQGFSQSSISLKNRSVVLGRDPAIANLVLEAPTVSRRHAVIDKDNQGNYLLQDYSTNGVFIDGNKVNGSQIIKPGSLVRIGPYTLVLRGDELVLVDQGKNIRLDADQLVRVVQDKKKKNITILNKVSLAIEPGNFVAIVGGSGAGKSTLMKTLLGIEPTTSGTVYLNGEDLRNNFNIYRSQLGYVPQSDIVHKDLTVGEALYYAAKLRLPPDSDLQQVIEKTLEQVQLSERKDTLVKDLSGGQLKRVSIGVELLADPKLFFLDEPTSGLDPGLDKEMMQLLASLADQGRTIILVTHATNNIVMCDRLVFLGRGGHLCYYGPPEEAVNFFAVGNGNFSDIYIKLKTTEAVQESAAAYQNSKYYKEYIENRLSTTNEANTPNRPEKVKGSFFQQLVILTQRYLKLIFRDKLSLVLSVITAPLGIALITLALWNKDPLFLEDGANFDDSSGAAPLALKVLFVFTCAALWVGLSSSLQEIVKESEIYKRERLVNLSLFAYIGSKVFVLGGLALIQTILVVITVLIAFKSPATTLLPWSLGLGITTFLTLFASMALGLTVSAWVKNSTQANIALPILLLPQIIFSGVLFDMTGLAKYFSWLMLSRWSIGSYGILANIQRMVAIVKDTDPVVMFNAKVFDDPYQVYVNSWDKLGLTWVVLACHIIIYLLITLWLQKRKDIA